jgi:hypothetical protein
MQIARTEKDLKVAAQIELRDAIFVQLERFVVNRPDEEFIFASDGIEHRAGFRILLGLREHEPLEVFGRKTALSIEKRAIQVFIDRDVSGIEGREGKIVAVVELVPVEVEGVNGKAARSGVPAIGQNHATYVPEQRGDLRHAFSFALKIESGQLVRA